MPGVVSIKPSKRQLHFFWLCDVSSSMQGEKLASLNTAIREVLPALRQAAQANTNAEILVHAITFGAGARSLTPPTPLETFTWNDIPANDGRTDLGAGLSVAADHLGKLQDVKMLPPVLIVVSDGLPNDDWRAGLARLEAAINGVPTIRVAIAIGDDADRDVLKAVVKNPENVKSASSATEIKDLVKWASQTAIKVASAPNNQAANANALLPAAQQGGTIPVVTGGQGHGPVTFV